MTGDEIGYAWLVARYDLQVIQPLPVESRIGRRRHTYDHDGRRQAYYTEGMRPDSTLGAHLTFALKHAAVADCRLGERPEHLCFTEGASAVSSCDGAYMNLR